MPNHLKYYGNEHCVSDVVNCDRSPNTRVIGGEDASMT